MVGFPGLGSGFEAVGEDAGGEASFVGGLPEALGSGGVVEIAELFVEGAGFFVADASADVGGHGLVEVLGAHALAFAAVPRGVADGLHAGGVVLAAAGERGEKGEEESDPAHAGEDSRAPAKSR